jgi:energy-coupling factor transport system ATP-binding protein
VNKLVSKKHIKNTVVEVDNLTYTYRKALTPAISNVSFQVNQGEFVGIIGPTGAGKTTLCMCINGLIPHALGGDLIGNVICHGLNTRDYDMPELSKHVGITFQDPESQIFGMSVEEDLAFGPENLGIQPEIIRSRIDKTLETIRMINCRFTTPWKLSGGQKQRVAIGSALTMLPEILVFDEPLSELDPIGKSEVMKVIAQLNKVEGYTVFLVEHNAELLNEFADRIIVLNNGSILLDGTPKEVFKNATLLNKIKVGMPQVTRFQLNWLKKPSFDEYVITDKNELVTTIKKKEYRVSGHDSKSSKKDINNNSEEREVVIRVEDLCQDYNDDSQILDCINLQIIKGDFVSVIGQNGAGKTTLVKHFNGLLKPCKGKVTVLGKDTNKTTIAELSKKVGYVFQNPDHQIFSTTVKEEVLYGLNIRGFSEDEKEKRMFEALKTVDLWDQKEEDPLSLGKGARQKLALASVIAIQPEILIIDEPTTGMDYNGCVNIMELINKLHDYGMTIIMITHDMWVVSNYSKRVIVMGCGGRILLDDIPEIVFQNMEILNQVFVKPPSLTEVGIELGFDRTVLKEEDLIRLI